VHNKIANPAGNSGAWFTTTSSTAQNTGFSVSITPKFANSMLLVRVMGNYNMNYTGTVSAGLQTWIRRDGTNIHSGGNNSSGSFSYMGSGSNATDRYMQYLHENLISAGSTATTTFTLWVATWTNIETVRLGGHDGQTTITVTEIAG
jgi:hypothetical protein